MTAIDGRRFAPEVTAIAMSDAEGRTVLSAPMPGLFRGGPVLGAVVAAGSVLGELEVLGLRHRVIVPATAHGAVIALGEGRRVARRAVEHGEALVTLDPAAISGGSAAKSGGDARAAASGALVFRAPMSGRYYAKPAPDAEPFVKVGDVVETGRSVAVLEVMKTFNRVAFGGAGVPERAKVVAIVPRDGDDVSAGDPLLELEPA